jgi:hypothetical protein
MSPALAFGHLVDRRRQRRRDEAGIWRLDPYRRRFSPLESHHSPKPQNRDSKSAAAESFRPVAGTFAALKIH